MEMKKEIWRRTNKDGSMLVLSYASDPWLGAPGYRLEINGKSAGLRLSLADREGPTVVEPDKRPYPEYTHRWANIALTTPQADELRLALQKAAADAAMEKQAQSESDLAEAQAACPAGHVPCLRLWANGDLCSGEYLTPDGVHVLASDLLESHKQYYFVPDADVAKARERAKNGDATRQIIEEAREAGRKKLLEVVVPAVAVAAYKAYQGDAAAAYEAEDVMADHYISKFGLAIAAQNLAPEATTAKLAKRFQEGVREQYCEARDE